MTGGASAPTGGSPPTSGSTAPTDATPTATTGNTAGADALSPTLDAAAPSPTSGAGFRIYWIDTEGGASTLLISPTGETLLADAGWIGARDVPRLLQILDKELGARHIDYFLTTHFHNDHDGAAPALVKAVTISTFIDHGAVVRGGEDYTSFTTALAGAGNVNRITAQAGQTLKLGDVTLTIVSAAHKVAQGLPTAIANPACQGVTAGSQVEDEDPQSVGFVARYGSFDFVALGDLTVGVEHDLACPMNQIGHVEIFQSSQHGIADSNCPELVFGLRPEVIVVNNGPSKGGAEEIFTRFKASPDLKDLWALHRSLRFDDLHNADEALTANAQPPDGGHWLRAVARPDGTFVMTNGRTSLDRPYPARAD
jgi:competence protein ComEC